MADIRIKDLPVNTPILGEDFFVFEKNAGGGIYVTSTNKLSAIGSAGAQGVQGVQGIGSAGSQGAQGLQGVGSQGTQGLQGVGSQGVQGLQGVGSQGVQGLQGVGSQGVQGLQGVGAQGTQGTQGVQGLQGEGSQGVQGVANQGTQGLSNQGVQGTQGLQGVGSQGVQGPAGSTQGTQGATGNQGDQGLQGVQGLSNQGVQGLSNQGVQGLQGESIQGTQGLSNQGVQGLSNQGVQGIAGATGAAGQSTSYYRYLADTTATGTPPGSGDIRWNNVTQGDATTIHVSHLTDDGVDVDIFLALVKQGDNLVIQDRNNSANYQKWNVTSAPTVVDNSYVSFSVALVTSTHSFSNDDQLILALAASGAQGVTGNQGTQGLSNQGVQGLQGDQGIQGIGVQGTIGNQGVLGSQGVQGIIGTTFDYTAVSSNITLESNNGYIFDTTSGALTVTLPTSPSVGAYINITLTRGNSNNLTIARNSSNINGAAEDLICDVSSTFSLVYTDATTGWKFIPFSGITTPTIKVYKATWAGPYTGPTDNLGTGSRIPYNTNTINSDSAVFGGLSSPGSKTATSIHIKVPGTYQIISNLHLFDQLDGRNLYVQLWTFDSVNNDVKRLALNDFNAGTGLPTNDLIITGNALLNITQPNTYLYVVVNHDFPGSGPFPSRVDGITGNSDTAATELTIVKLA